MTDIELTAAAGVLDAIWRAEIDILDVQVVTGPQVVTLGARLDPLDMGRATAMQAELTAASGSSSPVRIAQLGAWLSVQIPASTPLRVHLCNMRAQGLTAQIGLDDCGNPKALDLLHPDTGHVFAAGRTRRGKTGFLRSLVALLAMANAPDKLGFVLIDPKGRSFPAPLSRLAHLEFAVAVTDEDRTAALVWCASELQRRIEDGRPRVAYRPLVIVVDEMHLAPKAALDQIAKMGIEVGMYLVCASQEMTATDVKARVGRQFGARACFGVAPGDWRTSQAVIGTSDALSCAHAGDAFAVIGGWYGRIQVAHATLFDPDGAPDHPYWHDVRWDAITRDPSPIPGAPVKVAHPSQTRQPITDVELVAAFDPAARWFTSDGRERVAGVGRIEAAAGVGTPRAQWVRDIAQAALDDLGGSSGVTVLVQGARARVETA